MNTNEFGTYHNFLDTFIKHDYVFKTFKIFEHGKDKQVILRHDIDFDIQYAYAMSLLENSYGIDATYFFIMTLPFYSILEEENRTLINNILKHHDISLHFNPGIYGEDVKVECYTECSIFFKTFCIFPKIISIHKPAIKSFSSYAPTIEHTYKKQWFGDIKYISDSRGFFREGNPFESEWFKKGQSVQCNIHPIWWMQSGRNPTEKILKWHSGQYSRTMNTILNDFNLY